MVCGNIEAKHAYERLLEYKRTANLKNNGHLKKRIKDGIKTSKIVFGENTPMRFVLADELSEMLFTYDSLGHYDGKDFDQALDESVSLLNSVQQDFAKVASAVILAELKNRFW